ncbi:MAG: PEP/pyruvate-binding domain-containing protein, partial [Bacteroidota bacterium]|nr:PEP/pyruvate-binding domain-containing protein [Bacteroidota bacterium]
MKTNSGFEKGINFPKTPFARLMQKRINRVLIVSSKYDRFALEEDGRIEEQIFNEYSSLNLRYPPRFTHVHSADKALKLLQSSYFDLVITMLNVGGTFDAFQFSAEVKKIYSGKPVVLLTPFSREISIQMKKEDLSSIDYVFGWLGSADILVAIIKLLEDKMNVDKDIKLASVQTIILVEDSVRYYSGYLTTMYKILLLQSLKFMKEGLNTHRRMLRMRGRPKILLATNYEQALDLYEDYKDHLLGIISDIKYPRNNKIDKNAGLRLFKRIKKENKYLPLLLQSSDKGNEEKAKALQVGFIHKLSENLSKDLTDFMNEYFAFGPFQFRDPKTKKIVAVAKDLKHLQHIIYKIPDAAFHYHVSRNHISKWLNARALFPIANFFVDVSVSDFDNDLNKMRDFLYHGITGFRKSKSRGVIAKFDADKFDNSLIFTRMGDGYMGGKARGLAFLDMLVKENPDLNTVKDVTVGIPSTVVITTEIYDKFIEMNKLYYMAKTDIEDEKILERFIDASLPEDTRNNLKVYLTEVERPIAVRSSSVLEDSHYQPFAGVFSTFMLSNSSEDIETRLEQLEKAIKSVYASVFYKGTKAYMAATKNLIDEEKMAVILQVACGRKYDNLFYPSFSGVARSVNFYPIGNEQPDEGIVNIGMGLGKYIVEGKRGLRFSPHHPKNILQLSSPEMALRETQKHFYSLDLDPEKFKPSIDEAVNFKYLRISKVQSNGSLDEISSVFDFQNDILREGTATKGKPVITFANILKYKTFPLTDIIKKVLIMGKKAMNNPVEIEFAVQLSQSKQEFSEFKLLQIRPIIERTSDQDLKLEKYEPADLLIYSKQALGYGSSCGIEDVVYIRPELFDAANNEKIVSVIEQLNEKFRTQGKNYILIGPGRWGSSDPWLGVPVKWAQISQAGLIVEVGIEGYQVDPSQGTHFFQNLTSLRVGYFTVNTVTNDGHIDFERLDALDAEFEQGSVRHVRLKKELIIKIDGKRSRGIVIDAEKEK